MLCVFATLSLVRPPRRLLDVVTYFYLLFLLCYFPFVASSLCLPSSAHIKSNTDLENVFIEGKIFLLIHKKRDEKRKKKKLKTFHSRGGKGAEKGRE
jgi:hypothetical protein